MIGDDLPNYIKYNPKLFAHTYSGTGLVLETFDSNIALALVNNSSNVSNIFLLKSENNTFKIQYDSSNVLKDIISYTYYSDSNIQTRIYGDLTTNHIYTTDYINPSIILNDNNNQIAGFGFNKSSNTLYYKTTFNGNHTFTANAGSLEMDLVTINYSNSVQQLLIHGDNIPIINDSNPSLRVQGSTKIDGNLNVNGAITGVFPTNVVQLNSTNKIDATLLPQLAPDFRVFKSGKNIGIGTNNPLSKLHIYNGDILVQNGWIGINLNSNITQGYPPLYPLHINFETNTIPAIALTSNNICNFIAYANRPAIGIGTSCINSPNISIYATGDIQCSNVICSGLEIHKNGNAVLYYETYNNGMHALVSTYPLVLTDKLFVSTISSSTQSQNVNFSNVNVYIDKDLFVNNNSIQRLLNQIYDGQYIGLGTSNALYRLHVISSNSPTIAGFGSTGYNGAYINIYTSNDINKDFVIGIDNSNNFIIRDHISNDTNGIKYKSDSLFVDNLITSNITVLLSTHINGLSSSNGLMDYNYLTNKPFNKTNILNIDNYVSSNIIVIDNSIGESALDVKGKVRLYNDSSIYPQKVECDINSISFLTNTGIPYKYVSTNTINPLSVYTSGIDFSLNNVINNIIFTGSNQAYISNTNRAYLIYNGLYSSNIIFPNPLSNILDISFDDNTLYYISTIDNNVYFAGNIVNINTNILTYTIDYHTLIDNNTIKFINIDVGTNFGVLLDINNNLYSFGINNLYQLGRVIASSYTYNIINQITGLPSTIIQDISCGSYHTLVLLSNGDVWSFGDNSLYQRGYSGDPSMNALLIPPNKIATLSEPIVKINCSYNNNIILSKNGNVYIFGEIANKLNPSGTTPYLLTNLPKIIDISCGKNNVALLTYYNEIYTFNNLNTLGDYTGIGRDSSSGSQYQPLPVILPYNFYGISLQSHGSILIGNDYLNLTQNVPKNSLLIEGKMGIGTVSINQFNTSNNYSMIINGNINITNGNIYKNDILFVSGSGGNTSSSPNNWSLTETAIYYKGISTSHVGIGTTDPSRALSIVGDIGLTGNIYVNDELLVNNFLLWESSNNNIVYNKGKVGVNTTNAINTFDVFDTTFSIRNVVNISNLLSIDNNLILPLDSIPLLTTIDFGNNIAISGDGTVIAASIYKTYDDIFSSNNVYIYNKLNSSNYWNKTTIISPYKRNINFGNSLALSYSGDKLIIGAYKNYISTNVYSGSISICDINSIITDNNNIIYADTNSNIQLIYGSSNINSQLGYNVATSYYGNVIVSSAFGDNFNLYIYEKSGYVYANTLLNYANYNYHYSFGESQDITDDGKIIVTTFVINNTYQFLLRFYSLVNNFSYYSILNK